MKCNNLYSYVIAPMMFEKNMLKRVGDKQLNSYPYPYITTALSMRPHNLFAMKYL